MPAIERPNQDSIPYTELISVSSLVYVTALSTCGLSNQHEHPFSDFSSGEAIDVIKKIILRKDNCINLTHFHRILFLSLAYIFPY